MAAAAAATSNSSSSSSSSSSMVAAAAAAAGAAGAMPFKQLTIRPVMLKGKLLVQMSLLDSRQDTTKNYAPQEATEQLQQLLQLPWQSGSLQTLTATTNIQISRKGKVLLQTQPNPAVAGAGAPGLFNSSSSRGLKPAAAAAADSAAGGLISLQHDRAKALPINGSIADPFLQRIGLQTADGRIKASMQAKFTQINEFLKLLIHTGQLDHMGQQQQQQPSSSSSRGGSSRSSTLHVLDCGCGSSHLTFGTLHYLHHVRGLPLRLTGIDTNEALMQRSSRACADLGIADMAQFHTAAIRSYKPDAAPDIVLALHACDTATDEALALAVRLGTGVIMSVPCCQKDLHRQQAAAQQQQQQQQQQQRQVRRRPGSGSSGSGSGSDGEAGSGSGASGELFEPLLSHGILRQRMLDVLTDAFRAQLLQLAGYRTDVVEFVSTEHTPRNLLIRAVRQQRRAPEAEQARLAGQYAALKQHWGVTPHLEKLMREDGTLPDALRYLHRPLKASLLAAAGSSSASQQASYFDDCTAKDIPLAPRNSTLFLEYAPYGLAQIQAAANSSKLPDRTDDKGVLICVIDSGLDMGHPDMKGNSIDGCKYEDAFAPAGCPFTYSEDFVDHGTHIAGTIAAQRNGLGVVGVIPGAAEVYVVRVFNDSGDVNQGQGLVYGSTLILAFTQCEGRLAAMQRDSPAKQYRMVVSMSLGAAGPLSIERMYFKEALQRGDIIFVASSGNNGTAPTLMDGALTSMINPGNYPGSYPEVIAVAAVDCSNRLAPFSQKNPAVDLAAPGVNILSVASQQYAARAGFMAGGFVSDSPRAGSGSVFSQMAMATYGVTEAAPMMGVPEEPMLPQRFPCDAVDSCRQQGAKAVLLAAPATTTGYYGAFGLESPSSFQDMPLIASLDCSSFNCSCWPRTRSTQRPPVTGLSLAQYAEVKAALAASARASKPYTGTVDSREDFYQRLSGTSMAVPHVSGAIARVWSAFPSCDANVVRTAFQESALDLGPRGLDVQYGHGLVQAEAAYDYLARQPCAKGWALASLAQQAAASDAADNQSQAQFGSDASSSAGLSEGTDGSDGSSSSGLQEGLTGQEDTPDGSLGEASDVAAATPAVAPDTPAATLAPGTPPPAAAAGTAPAPAAAAVTVDAGVPLPDEAPRPLLTPVLTGPPAAAAAAAAAGSQQLGAGGDAARCQARSH
ncbi:hypothetical protein COO60DRAFT_1697337 [Scenedesmus sp. NREL 46B-D3]|nr:hypothetical protein COO60DRAFT_1697337 [Scenedesmus sp. NREL 46B-D3]